MQVSNNKLEISHNQKIAHIRKADKGIQTVSDHLFETAGIAQRYAGKIGFEQEGYVLGLLHDFGKFSSAFQNYIRSEGDLLDPDEDGYVEGQRGKIDHSTAGAQFLWEKIHNLGNGKGELCAQFLSLPLSSHHSGLIDILSEEGILTFQNRMEKNDDKTHLEECLTEADNSILTKLEEVLESKFLPVMFKKLTGFFDINQIKACKSYSLEESFRLGFFLRFLFSCLIDADRTSSADFETPKRAEIRKEIAARFSWDKMIDIFEYKIQSFKADTPVNQLRSEISLQCLNRSQDEKGIYTLTVPTGGGKTLSSLRYALHHAHKHNLDHVFYIIPYTSIIEQNAGEVRDIFKDHPEWILEHHSNLEPENQTWHSKLASENWDAPIVFTTMVQFLETLFSGGTSKVRRLHQLSKSVIIFDEIQSLPVNCTYIFCNALNFFVQKAGSTAILCTATQPLLDNLRSAEKGQLVMSLNSEIVSNQNEVFQKLERVEIFNRQNIEGWELKEIAELAIEQMNHAGSCLVIVNTKKSALEIYKHCDELLDDHSAIFHLSTGQYPVHRKKILSEVNNRLDSDKPVICISTQLIEAGVNIDFAAVIRCSAGLDSIAQAAGRCNRHGMREEKGKVFIVNPKDEKLTMLKDISIGKEKFLRICNEYNENDFLYPETISKFFNYYFYERDSEMVYPFKSAQDNSLLNILSTNNMNTAYQNDARLGLKIPILQQSFKLASQQFKAIDAPTQSMIVQHGEGEKIVADLCGMYKEDDFQAYYDLLKKAQKYSVSVFPNTWRKLSEIGAIAEIADEGIFYLCKEYYSEKFGVSLNIENIGGACV